MKRGGARGQMRVSDIIKRLRWGKGGGQERFSIKRDGAVKGIKVKGDG